VSSLRPLRRTARCVTARCVALAAALVAPAVVGAQAHAPPAPARPGRPALLDSARARLARLDGRVRVPGLDSAVEVRRDRWGVPHIYAKTQHDLFLAQGYVAAQDRLWQMEMWRRTGEGRLAEVIGPSAVARDRFARLMKYRGDMAAEWASYAPDAEAIVGAFVDGVNAYIAEVRERPPIEFTMLGVAPEPWTREVPLQRMAALAMTGNALSEVARAKLVALVGAERALELWPTDPHRPLDPAPGLDLAGVDERSLGAAREAYGAVAYARLEGSNNWVVSGARTASGKPMLANDPHRTIALPSLRYLTHLVGPGWNVIGAGEPSLPGVAAGHNERIGFGFTIVGMDQQDVYVETVGPCPAPDAVTPGASVPGVSVSGARRARSDPGRSAPGGPPPNTTITRGAPTTATVPSRRASGRCYLHDGAWTPVRSIVDTIRVKGAAPVVTRLEFTRHGPIVADDSARGRAYALRFVGSEPGTAGYLACLSLNRATDWPSFLRAAARWKLPTENLVYADVDGNIGWVAAGLAPVRRWSGTLPVPGDGRYEWEGFLPFAELPQRHNPPGGVIVTANNNVLPPGYPHALAYEWAPPYRADRIRGVLDTARNLTRQDFERLQHDELSLPASQLVPALLRAARRSPRGAPAASDGGVDALARWDFVMRRDALAPLLYEAWLQALVPRVLEGRAGPGWEVVRDEWDLPTLVRLVTAPAGDSAVASAAIDAAVLGAYRDAVADLERRLGPDRSRWRWGAVHRAPFRHPLAAAFDLEAAPRGGDGNTVNATGGRGLLQTHGASFREILDLADWDNSVATSTPGQSGQPGSPHYGDLLPLWRDGRYFPLVFSRERVVRETAHLLTLEPGGGSGR
jgi:penicillin G amidase